MSSLGIGPADSLKRLQNLAMITPPEKVEEPKKPKTDTEYKPQSVKQQEFYESFWEGMLTLFIKIPFIKNLTLFIWRFGLRSLQPSQPIKSSESLLFNSSVEIPKWFDDDMREQGAISLRNHFLAELKMISEKAPADLNSLVRLSQVKVSRDLYGYPLIIQTVQDEVKKATWSLIQKIQEKHPAEPLQLHLGGNSYENPLERLPLSGLFIEAFNECIEEHASEMPIRLLHIHGPCDNPEALKALLEGLEKCPSLYHLHLDLDEEGSKKVFQTLGRTLKKTTGLEFLVFRNYSREHPFLVHDDDWLELARAINSHRKLKTLSFYDLPTPPEIFKKALCGYEVCKPHANSSEGFCIKKL